MDTHTSHVRWTHHITHTRSMLHALGGAWRLSWSTGLGARVQKGGGAHPRGVPEGL